MPGVMESDAISRLAPCFAVGWQSLTLQKLSSRQGASSKAQLNNKVFLNKTDSFVSCAMAYVLKAEMTSELIPAVEAALRARC